MELRSLTNARPQQAWSEKEDQGTSALKIWSGRTPSFVSGDYHA